METDSLGDGALDRFVGGDHKLFSIFFPAYTHARKKHNMRCVAPLTSYNIILTIVEKSGLVCLSFTFLYRLYLSSVYWLSEREYTLTQIHAARRREEREKQVEKVFFFLFCYFYQQYPA